MARPSEVICFRCRTRTSASSAVRVCGPCNSELRAMDPLELAASFLPGDRVMVVEGVFAGQMGEVVSSDGDGLVMARSVIMKIPVEVMYLPWQLVKSE